MTESLSERRFWPLVLAVAAASLLWRIVYILVWRQDFFVWGDSYFYYHSGLLLADGNGWIDPLTFRETGAMVEAADHPPLYILFLGFWSLVGITGATAQMILTAIFVSTPTVVVSGLAGREIGGARLGVIAVVVAAVYPNIWSWEGTLLSEVVAMLLLVTVVWTAYRFHHAPSFGRAAVLGAVLGVGALSRAELLLLSVVVVVPLVLRVRTWPWSRRIATLAVAGLSCVAVLAPWVAFNLSRFERPVLLSEGYQVTLASATCDLTWYGEFTGYWDIRCAREYTAALGLTRENSDQSERSKVWLDGSLDYISDHLDRVPTVVAVRWLRVLGLWKPVQQADLDAFVDGREGWATKTAQTTSYAFLAAAVVGLVVLRRRGTTVLPLVGPLVVVLITITITFAQNRYRASVEPAIALLVAVAVEQAVRGWLTVRDDREDQAAVTPSN